MRCTLRNSKMPNTAKKTLAFGRFTPVTQLQYITNAFPRIKISFQSLFVFWKCTKLPIHLPTMPWSLPMTC